jgi:HEAT repeat protein
VQLAVVKALATSPSADLKLVDPLFALLSPYTGDRSLIDNAAVALTAFKTNGEVLNRLLSNVATGDERIRVACIRAAGTFVEKRVAASLVAMVDPGQPPAVVTAASQALAYLSGLDASTDAATWRNWWNQRKDLPENVFQAELARARSLRFDQTRRRYNDLETELTRLLRDAYDKTPRDQRADALLRYLRSNEPSARVVGCRIAFDAAGSDVTPDAVRQQLRQLIGDASADVRRSAATVLALINDADAVVPLLTQLSQETDPSVKAALVTALAPTRDPRTIPLLIKLLDDPSIETVQPVADALFNMGSRLRETNPGLANETAEKLVRVIEQRTRERENVDLRNSLVQALGALRSTNRGVQTTLLRMLSSPQEDPKVRRSLLIAVGGYGSPNFADAIANWITDKSDPNTRLFALRALGDSADFGAVQGKLRDLMDKDKEPQPEIRDAAWKVFVKLITKAPVEQLGIWEVNLQNEPQKLIVVLNEQRNRAQQTGNAELAAMKSQQLGDADLRATNYADAIKAYSAALEYAEANNKNIEFISEGLLRAYLRNRQFQEGIQFAERKIRQNRGFEGNLGPIIREEAEQLVNVLRDADAGSALIDRALKMDPALSGRQYDLLQQLQAQVRNRGNQRNESPLQPNEAVTAMAW